MKKCVLLINCLLAFAVCQAQVAVVVNSPASVAGPKAFAEPAADFTTTNLSSGTWTADAVFVDNGSATPTIGCDTVLNASELAGKIALIDRGICSFSEKVSRAEDAGAIAAIVFNNVPGEAPFIMASTAGFPVTIPAVMLSYEDGQEIRDAMNEGTINITLGIFSFANDISIDGAKVVNPTEGTIPIFAVENGDFDFTPGALIVNRGTNESENAIIQATIEHNGSQVYSESESIDMVAGGDTSDLVLLPTYVPPADMGYYFVDYEISSDSTDESDIDNTASSSFYVHESAFSKARWDEDNERPMRTNAYTTADGGNILFLSGFHLSNANGATLDSVQFYVAADSQVDTVFGNWASGSTVRVYAYLWDDINGDSVITVAENELTAIALNTVTLDPNLGSAWVTVELLDFSLSGPYTITEDEVDIFVGPRFEGSESAFFGFDEGNDQTLQLEQLAVSHVDYPYLFFTAWDDNDVPTGEPSIFNNGMDGLFGGSLATALYVTPLETSTKEPVLENVTVKLYPNPAADQFTAEVELPAASKFLEYSIRDASGRQLFSTEKNNVQKDFATFNVSTLPTGQYYLLVRTENGVATYPLSVQR